MEPLPASLGAVTDTSTHVDVERDLRDAGWTECGAGDWAFALVSPDQDVVARISPFDPVGPFTARLYGEAAATGRVPRLLAHRRLAGGGDLQVMERFVPVSQTEASTFLTRLRAPEPELVALADVVGRIHHDALRTLPWCGPLDENPSNVMRTTGGTLVLTDPYYADGPDLYAAAELDPDLFVTRIPAAERRYMTEIPLECSGPWPRAERDALRETLRRADEHRADERRSLHPSEEPPSA